MYNIAIFASGSGSNAENIIDYFRDHTSINIPLIVASSGKAFVLQRATRLKKESFVLTKSSFDSGRLAHVLDVFEITHIVLAGFLWKIPAHFIKKYSQHIINIHPALLPKYGGKGMYGAHIHAAVIDNKETESGITIHEVNENYDEGTIYFQATCPVEKEDTVESLATKIHALEYDHFPSVIESWILGSL